MTPRLPQVTAIELVAVLKQAGFEEHAQEGSHLVLKNPRTNTRLVVPIHSGDMGRGLLKKLIKHAGLSEAEFRKLL
jgi:predicted RNA binding protein YcfA (HicA-like mRNA interferase family)